MRHDYTIDAAIVRNWLKDIWLDYGRHSRGVVQLVMIWSVLGVMADIMRGRF